MSGNDWHRLDESDVRIRPGKGSRPRSKRRPDHAEASAAMVVGVDRGRWTCAVDEDPNHLVTAMRARELGKHVMRLYTGELLVDNVAWYRRRGYTIERTEAMRDRRVVHMMKTIEGE